MHLLYTAHQNKLCVLLVRACFSTIIFIFSESWFNTESNNKSFIQEENFVLILCSSFRTRLCVGIDDAFHMLDEKENFPKYTWRIETYFSLSQSVVFYGVPFFQLPLLKLDALALTKAFISFVWHFRQILMHWRQIRSLNCKNHNGF